MYCSYPEASDLWFDLTDIWSEAGTEFLISEGHGPTLDQVFGSLFERLVAVVTDCLDLTPLLAVSLLVEWGFDERAFKETAFNILLADCA